MLLTLLGLHSSNNTAACSFCGPVPTPVGPGRMERIGAPPCAAAVVVAADAAAAESLEQLLPSCVHPQSLEHADKKHVYPNNVHINTTFNLFISVVATLRLHYALQLKQSILNLDSY